MFRFCLRKVPVNSFNDLGRQVRFNNLVRHRLPATDKLEYSVDAEKEQVEQDYPNLKAHTRPCERACNDRPIGKDANSTEFQDNRYDCPNFNDSHS